MKMNSFETSISKEELNKKPIIQFNGNIHIIENRQQADIAFSNLFNVTHLGFDTETKPIFKKGKKNKIALLQLSTAEDAYIFRLNKFVPEKVFALLADKSIVKIGAAIRDDIAGLQKIRKFEPESFVELQEYVKTYNIEDNGLKKLSAIILGSRISKSQQTSNWENEVLTEAQLIYAATDAWVCLEIFKKLNHN